MFFILKMELWSDLSGSLGEAVWKKQQNSNSPITFRPAQSLTSRECVNRFISVRKNVSLPNALFQQLTGFSKNSLWLIGTPEGFQQQRRPRHFTTCGAAVSSERRARSHQDVIVYSNSAALLCALAIVTDNCVIHHPHWVVWVAFCGESAPLSGLLCPHVALCRGKCTRCVFVLTRLGALSVHRHL